MSRTLESRIAVVAGATRGAGRGIATALGEAGATVYCTGRSVRGSLASGGNRPETIEETAEIVTARGGRGIAVRVDHTDSSQVRELFRRVKSDEGKLHILVNDIWGGDALTEWGKPFWELDLEKGFTMMDRAVRAHIITSRYGVPLMIESGEPGLVVEITDGDEMLNTWYRGNMFYDLVKIAPMRLVLGMAQELRDTPVTPVCVTPGFLRSEMMLDHFGVREENWRDAVEKDPYFAHSESPLFVGRAVAALASDDLVGQKAGRALASWTLAKEYGFTDEDGRQPDIGGVIMKAADERWSAIVKAAERSITELGLDAESGFENDRSRLELRATLGDGGWFVWQVNWYELITGEPETEAGKFVQRFRKARGTLPETPG